MALTGQKTIESFNCTGLTAYDLSADFIFWDDTDLSVSYFDTDGVETVLTLVSDFTVSGGSGSSGTVTTVATYSSGTLVVYRDTAKTQDYDGTVGDGFNTDTFELSLDRTVGMVQELSRKVDNSVRLESSDASGANMEIPAITDKTDRALNFLQFDENGDLVVAKVVGDIGTFTVSPLDIASAIVQRDTNGDFAARNVTVSKTVGDVAATDGTVVLDSGTDGTDATFSGDVTGNVTGNLTGNVTGDLTGTASSVTSATKAEQITGTETAKSVTPAVQQHHKSAVKAWVNFNGADIVAALASYNVSSIIDNGLGDYTINLINSFADVNFATTGTVGGGGSGNNIVEIFVQTASSCNVRTKRSNGTSASTLQDYPFVMVSFSGNN